jgi:hypothetical protein
LIDLLAFDRGIKGPVEVFESSLIPETGPVFAFLNQALVTDVEFVLKDQFEELIMGQLMGLGLLQAQFQAG